MGRKSKYNNDVLVLCEAWARKGFTEKSMAKALGVSVSTFEAWKGKFPEFVEALRRGKEPVNEMVVSALLKRALGYEVDEVTIEKKRFADGQEKPETIKTTTKHIVPDVGAAKLWLTNRLPEEWSEKRKLEVSGHLNQMMPDLSNLTSKEIDDLEKIYGKIRPAGVDAESDQGGETKA